MSERWDAKTFDQRARLHSRGEKGEIWLFAKESGRWPAAEFLKDMPEHLLKRFERTFERFRREGMNSARNETFKQMGQGGQRGKGVWEFKTFDQRLFATQVPSSNGSPERVALLCGWVKDRTKSLEEKTQVDKALALREECLALDWDQISAPKAESAEPGREMVDMKRMAGLLDVNYYTFSKWVHKGWIHPQGKKEEGGRQRLWTWEEVDQVIACAERVMIRLGRTPKAGRSEVQAPAPPVEKKEEEKAAVEEPGTKRPRMSRPELFDLARMVVDGEADVETFVSCVQEYRARYDYLHRSLEQLERLRTEFNQLTEGKEDGG